MRAALLAAGPIARSMAWGPLAGAAVVAGAVVASARPWEGQRLSLAGARVVAGLVAVGVAFTVDDSAAVTLASSPTSLLLRRAVRLGWAAAAALVVLAAAVMLGGGTGGLHLGRLAVEATGMVLAALALAVAWGGDRGAFLASGGMLSALVFQQRWPDRALFPFGPGPAWSGSLVAWWVIAAASAVAVVALSSRGR